MTNTEASVALGGQSKTVNLYQSFMTINTLSMATDNISLTLDSLSYHTCTSQYSVSENDKVFIN